MPMTLTVHESYPTHFEDIEIIGAYLQTGTDVPYYNCKTKSILPGEPIVIYGRIGISKEVILPGHFGTVVFGCLVDFLLDPSMAAQILQGANVYFDLGLATGLIPGYATGVQPTNGYLLGQAVAVHYKPGEVPLASGVPIAASTSSKRVQVLLTGVAPTTYGTVTNFATYT